MKEFDVLSEADADRLSGIRGRWRTARRMINRCWLDREMIARPRFFCQNIGGCGSTYLVQLLLENGIERVFHEKSPDLNALGIEHFANPISESRLVRILRYTRHNVFFEANNRFFTMTGALASAFPQARFIHLYRDPADSVCGAMSKPAVESYLKSNLRLRTPIAGPTTAGPFERFCHHWRIANERILEDLQGHEAKTGQTWLTLRFEDLIVGDLDSFETFIGLELKKRVRPPVNQRPSRSEGRFPRPDQWSERQRSTLDSICGPLSARLKILSQKIDQTGGSDL